MKVDENDKQYRVTAVREVRIEGGGPAFSVQDYDGWLFYCANDKALALPKSGESMRQYGKGIGFPVRGLVIGERVYFYRTEAEEKKRHEDEVRATDERKAREFETNLPQWERDLAALPEPFRKRIERFVEIKKSWAVEYGTYEMFVCKEAVKIASSLGTVERIANFAKAMGGQRKQVPTLSGDHSGNTFGAACLLAQIYLEDTELLPKAHGALCPLVGCANYGCFAAYKVTS